MNWLLLVALLAGFYPWTRAWFAVRRTALGHALVWAGAAWLSWGAALADPQAPSLHYLALVLTACAGVAVLGARRPHVEAWNFVVAGLLAVMALPLLENLVRGNRELGPVRIVFLSATLLVALGNYLPTRLGPAAFLVGIGCAGDLLGLVWAEPSERLTWACHAALVLAPWAGWACWAWMANPRSELDGLWLDFRDKFGALWSLRVREQFNHAAYHAGWPVLLTWSGVECTESLTEETMAEMRADFQALIRRFAEPT